MAVRPAAGAALIGRRALLAAAAGAPVLAPCARAGAQTGSR